MIAPTLSVHIVGNGNRVVALDLDGHAVEHSTSVGLLRPESHVLLAEMLELGLDGHRLLDAIGISS
jgi:hypothetical protein